MQGICVALLLTLWPSAATLDEPVRIDWSRATTRDSELASLRSEYAMAVNARDEARVSDLYVPDALSIGNDGTLVRGARALASKLIQRPASEAVLTLQPRRFSVAGTVASEIGTTTELVPGSGESAPIEGVYVTIYSRGVDGRWRMAMEVHTTGTTRSVAIW